MGGFNIAGGDISAGAADLMKRRGLYQRLHDITAPPEPDDGLGLPPGMPRNYGITDHWDTGKVDYGPIAESAPPAKLNPGGTAAPPTDNRIDDDHPLRQTAGGPMGPQPTYQTELENDRNQHGEGQASPLIEQVRQASNRLADAMQPHGIEALHANARNPFVRGLEKFGIGALKGLDVAGSVLSPGTMTAIPGSRLNQHIRRWSAQKSLDTALENELKESQAANYRSEAANRQTRPDIAQSAAGRRQLAEEYGLQGDDRIRYILTGQMPVAADKPNLPEQVRQRAQLADQYGLQGADRQRYILTGQMPTGTDKPSGAEDDTRFERISAAKRLGQQVSREDEAWAAAYRERKTLGPEAAAAAASGRQTVQQRFEINRDARKEIQAAEKTYRNAKEAGDALDGFIQLARSGNKEAGATVPLEGTLRIVTSQGVKRINRTEVEGIEGAGSLFDRIQSKIGKWQAGQPIPPDLLNDFEELNATLVNKTYQQYSDHYDQTRALYEPAGADFGKIKKIAPPGQQLKDHMHSQGGPQSGMVRFQDSQGGIHDIPRGNLEKARKRDPGLRILGQ